MNEKQPSKIDKNPFYVRAKQVEMNDEEYNKRRLDNDHLLIMDTRGQIYRLAGMGGEFMRDSKYNKEYPVLMRVQENKDGEFDILNIISEHAGTEATNGDDEKMNIAENSK